MLRIVVDTNIWVRALMGGKVSLPVLQALQGNQFTLLVSKELLTELREVAQRPRLKKAIDDFDLEGLLQSACLRTEANNYATRSDPRTK